MPKNGSPWEDIQAEATRLQQAEERLARLLTSRRSAFEAKVSALEDLLARERQIAKLEQSLVAAAQRLLDERRKLADGVQTLLDDGQAADGASSPGPENGDAPAVRKRRMSPLALDEAPEPDGGEDWPAGALEADETMCPQCGTVLAHDALLCFACGHRMPVAAASEEPEGRGTKRTGLTKILKRSPS